MSDLYEEMGNSSDPRGTSDISKKSSLQSKNLPYFGKMWGNFFLMGCHGLHFFVECVTSAKTSS